MIQPMNTHESVLSHVTAEQRNCNFLACMLRVAPTQWPCDVISDAVSFRDRSSTAKDRCTRRHVRPRCGTAARTERHVGEISGTRALGTSRTKCATCGDFGEGEERVGAGRGGRRRRMWLKLNEVGRRWRNTREPKIPKSYDNPKDPRKCNVHITSVSNIDPLESKIF